MTIRETARATRVATRRLRRSTASRLRSEVDYRRSRDGAADLALFHELAPPPAGGGHQFLRGLLGELARRGLSVEENRISGSTTACLFNSFNLDAARLRRFTRADVRMVHRIDGPVGAYRGFDDGTDARVMRLNELADATIVQSRFSLDKHRELGLEPRNPVIIPNAPDPAIFHPPASRTPLAGRPLRVVAASWSANPRKGADALAWLDANLDPARFELTFVGNVELELSRVRVVAPLPSADLAELFRRHDAYLAASRDDPCSNALLEALACGLPAVYLRSGGHPELVGDAGTAYEKVQELGDAFDALARDHERLRALIRVPSLADVTDRYLAVLRG